MIYQKSLVSAWDDKEIIQIQINGSLCCSRSLEALDPRGGTHFMGVTHASLASEVNRAAEEKVRETPAPNLRDSRSQAGFSGALKKCKDSLDC